MDSGKIVAIICVFVLGVVLMAGAASSSNSNDSRPRMVQSGAVIVSVDRVSGAVNPIRYLVIDVDGPWIRVNLLKKKKQAKKGKPFWLKVDDIGAFIVE